jgi:hypothetical protein
VWQLRPHKPAAHAQRGEIRLVTEALGELQAPAQQTLDIDFYDRVLLTPRPTLCDLEYSPLSPRLNQSDRLNQPSRGNTDAMTGSLIALPLRLGLRGAGIAVQGATAVAERLVGIAAQLADAVTRDGSPDLDLDGSEHGQPEPAPPPERGQETESSHEETESTQDETPDETESIPDDESPPTSAEPAPAPGAAATASPPDAVTPQSEPLPDLDPAEGHDPAEGQDPAEGHVSEEATLVEEVAEPGAEDGAGAEVHVAEPWEGYREFAADDVIDRIRGVSSAELAAVELYELSHRNRKTVLAAVQRELARADR